MRHVVYVKLPMCYHCLQSILFVCSLWMHPYDMSPQVLVSWNKRNFVFRLSDQLRHKTISYISQSLSSEFFFFFFFFFFSKKGYTVYGSKQRAESSVWKRCWYVILFASLSN